MSADVGFPGDPELGPLCRCEQPDWLMYSLRSFECQQCRGIVEGATFDEALQRAIQRRGPIGEPEADS